MIETIKGLNKKKIWVLNLALAERQSLFIFLDGEAIPMRFILTKESLYHKI